VITIDDRYPHLSLPLDPLNESRGPREPLREEDSDLGDWMAEINASVIANPKKIRARSMSLS
jgi:hypothetical protein